jgi:Protein of unknown function (DUF1580)
MIDYENETVFPLTEAPAQVPLRRGGKKINLATVYRWSTRGIRGVVLETIQIGGTRCTSAQALQRFFDRLSTAGRDPDCASGGIRHPASVRRRHRDDQATVAELERLGL